MQTIKHNKVRDAVNNIIQNHAFYATILMQQNIIEDNSSKNPTFYVDGKNLAYNSKFADSISFDEVKGVLIHEVMHLVLLHHCRMGKRDSKIWNKNKQKYYQTHKTEKAEYNKELYQKQRVERIENQRKYRQTKKLYLAELKDYNL